MQHKRASEGAVESREFLARVFPLLVKLNKGCFSREKKNGEEGRGGGREVKLTKERMLAHGREPWLKGSKRA